MNNLRGILLVIAAMAAFAIEDSFVKQLTQSLPYGQVMLLLGAGGSLVFYVLARRKGRAVFARSVFSRALVLRTLSEAVAATFFITALALVPLSTVAAVFQATPLAITLGAALFMGEDVGWRRWSAIIIGFIGVLIIIRPGFEGFEPASLYVLFAVFGIAARDLLTRVIPEETSSTVVSFYGFFALVLASPVLMTLTGGPQPMNATQSGYTLMSICFGVSGYYMIVAAMRMGDASAIMPFRYARLIFSIILGVLFFNESPDALTYIGSAIVIASGLYTFLREAHLARQARRAAH